MSSAREHRKQSNSYCCDPKAALGQKLPGRPRNAISALSRSTDINRPTRLVRFVPITDVGRFVPSIPEVNCLLDHLIGSREERRRHAKAKGVGGLEVDHQLELGR